MYRSALKRDLRSVEASDRLPTGDSSSPRRELEAAMKNNFPQEETTKIQDALQKL